MKKIFLLGGCVLAVAACSNAKDQLGLTKKAPDEFAVVKRAPLSMPPDYALRPPAPGAPRPQEQRPAEQAKEAVFGQKDNAPVEGLTAGENAFLKQAGASNANPSIRRVVDSETALDTDKNKPVVKKLLNLAGQGDDAKGTVVDAKKEAERIQANKAAGKPVTEGKTPSVKE